MPLDERTAPGLWRGMLPRHRCCGTPTCCDRPPTCKTMHNVLLACAAGQSMTSAKCRRCRRRPLLTMERKVTVADCGVQHGYMQVVHTCSVRSKLHVR